MSPYELRDYVRHQLFRPFRLVMTNGTGYEIKHPDLPWIGLTTAHVGLTGEPGRALYERVVFLDLAHVIRLEPLPVPAPTSSNGQGQ